MTSVQLNLASTSTPRPRVFSRLLSVFTLGFHRRPILDIAALPDHLRRDIGLPPADVSLGSDIKMMNVNIRSGMIFPRPC